MKLEIPTGSKFGRLTITGSAPSKQGHPKKWSWICECGKEGTAQAGAIRRGSQVSCGCYKRTINKPNPNARTRNPIYQVWRDMKDRCIRKKCRTFKHYGGRGISVCQRWMSFDNFVADMPGWERGLTLERKDVNGNYCPDNCKWATHKQQANNMRKNRNVSIGGKSVTLAQAAEILQIPYHRLYSRLVIKGWSMDRAFDVRKYPH